MIDQSIEEIMDAIVEDPRAWAEMFLEARQSLESMSNLIDVYQQLLKPFVEHQEPRKKSSNLH